TRRTPIEIRPHARTNQLVVIGPVREITEALAIIDQLDVPIDVESRMYQFDVIAADRMDRLIKELVGTVAVQTRYRSAIDRVANLPAVTATEDIHKRIAELIAELDNAATDCLSPIRFYTLAHRTAADVLSIISGIEGEQ